MVTPKTYALLEDVVIECVHQVLLVFGRFAGLGVNKEVPGILQIDDQMLLTSCLGPPHKIVDLILLSNVVCLGIRVL